MLAKTEAENGVISCFTFCLRLFGPLERLECMEVANKSLWQCARFFMGLTTYGMICERGKRSNRGAVHGGGKVWQKKNPHVLLWNSLLLHVGNPSSADNQSSLSFNLYVYEFFTKAHCIEAKLYLLMYTKYVTHRGNFTAISAVDW